MRSHGAKASTLRQACVIALAACAAVPAACTGDAATSTAPATTRSSPTTWPMPADMKFDVMEMTIKDKKFTIEVAENELQIERGLMFRPWMPADHGMLFVFTTPSTVGFWMKNTDIPLDIIFIDPDRKVIVIHDRKPHDENGMGPDRAAQWVIELNAGTAKQIGLKPGDTVAIPAKYLKR